MFQPMRKLLFAVTMSTVALTSVMAQYPQVDPSAQQQADAEGARYKPHRDSAWAEAYKIVMKEAREGRPYVPWAY